MAPIEVQVSPIYAIGLQVVFFEYAPFSGALRYDPGSPNLRDIRLPASREHHLEKPIRQFHNIA